MNRTNNFDQSL